MKKLFLFLLLIGAISEHSQSFMIKTVKPYFFAAIVLLFATFSCQQKLTRPNVIYILADDLGYGDLGCYGQQYIETPNIDRLANTGIKLTRHFSGSAVCAPSRSSLLTGLHTGHTPIRGNKEFLPEGQEPMPDTVMTTAKFFKSQGYVTGATGKWGLGFINTSGDPANQGFDYFYGYNCQREAHRYYPDHLWENEKRIALPENENGGKQTYAQDLIHEQALEFISKNSDRSFYLYLPYIAPHAELIAPDDSLLQYYQEKLKGMEGKPFIAKKGGDYGPEMIVSKYASQNEPRVHFAAMVARLDVYVGQIMTALENAGIADNTLVIFTSDNGPHKAGGADPLFFDSNGPFRGFKRDLYDGGVRVPFIANMPSKIPAGLESDVLSAFWDMNSTYADLLEVEYSAKTDGISIWPALTGKKQENIHEELYWEFHEQGGSQAVRTDDWKGIRLKMTNNPQAPIRLYHLANDPGEVNDVSVEHPDIVAKMIDIMEEQHTPSKVFKFKFEKILR